MAHCLTDLSLFEKHDESLVARNLRVAKHNCKSIASTAEYTMEQ